MSLSMEALFTFSSAHSESKFFGLLVKNQNLTSWPILEHMLTNLDS